MSELRTSPLSDQSGSPAASASSFEDEHVRDPMGSFFDPIPDATAAETLLAHRSKLQLDLVALSDGEDIVVRVLEILGYIPEIPKPVSRTADKTVDDYQQQRTEWQAEKEAAIAARRPARELVGLAASYYRFEYWDDFATGRGLDIDRLGQLFERTETYAHQSPLHSVISTIKDQHPAATHIADAQRIIKILLLNEQESVEQDLP